MTITSSITGTSNQIQYYSLAAQLETKVNQEATIAMAQSERKKNQIQNDTSYLSSLKRMDNQKQNSAMSKSDKMKSHKKPVLQLN